jgi:asparagine synthase (glutamine-hydrolysing)
MSAPDFLAWLGPTTYANEIEALSSSLSPTRFSGAMQLWASDHVIPIGDHGFIIGHLFDRSARSDQIRSFDATEARAIIATDGQRLLSNYWGGYVAFLQGTNGEISVIRDPSGAVPAYYRSTTEGIWITAELGHGPFAPGTGGVEPDGDALLVHLWNPFYLGRQTCLKNVEELLPGHRLRYLDSTSRTETAWSPSWFLPTRMTRDIDAADLRAIVMNAVQAWAIPFDSILTGLSGGLDSSIVCAALAGSTAQNHGLNLIWPDREGDERIPAQLVADFLETDLTASLYNLDHIAIERPIVSTAARPFTSHYVQGIVAQRMALMEHLPIDAFFSGNGGDNVFCLIRSVAPILDRARSGHGLAALFSTISDVIRLTGTDYLTVLQHLASRAWRKATQQLSGNDDHLNQERLLEAIANVDRHPWDMIDGGAKPGSLAHIRMIRRAMGNDGFHP